MTTSSGSVHNSGRPSSNAVHPDMSADGSRTSQNASANRGFGGSRMSWNTNIWGDSNLGNGFAEGQHPSFDGKSGSSSLLSTSESDSWSDRSHLPWNMSTLPLGQHKPVAARSAHGRSNGLITTTLAETAGSTSYFALPCSSELSTSAGSSGHKTFLGSGSGGISPPDDSFSSLSGFRHVGGRGLTNSSPFGTNPVGSTLSTKDTFSSAVDASRPGEMTGSMAVSPLSQGAPDAMPQPLARSPYNHVSRDSASFVHQRPIHSATNSFHSEGRCGNGSMDISGGINKLQLADSDLSTQLRRPSYLSHTSYDTPLQRLRYQSDGGRYQTMAGYGAENSAGVVDYVYQTAKNSAGECDPSSGYSRMGSAFYPTENSDLLAKQYRDLSKARLSESQAIALERRIHSLQQGQDYAQHSVNPLQRMQFSSVYDFAGYQAAQLGASSGFYPMGQLGGLGAAAMISRTHRDHDLTQAVRSPLLEEFRANSKGNKRYELKDIYNHIVEFSGDQHGSRFIQQKLESANSDEKEQVFREIQPNCLQLMTDVFGNYVVQKLFEHGNQSQKKILANQMKGHVLALSTQMYGCRVVQKALEHILTDQQASMVKELENSVLKCVRDQNGNHVIQKAIERVPSPYVQFIINAFRGQVSRLAAHPYGCRVIQRMLEHCEEFDRESILAELHACTLSLIPDQFGNYVIQHVIENGEEKDRSRMINVVMSQLFSFSKHKFASNVVEKSIEFGEETQRRQIIQALTASNDGEDSSLLGLMRDQYGNYVIQKVLGQLKSDERDALIEKVKPLLSQLKKFSYGKQIVAIEKLIFDPVVDHNDAMRAAPSTTPPNSHKSSPQPSKQPLTNIGNCQIPVVGAAPPTPPPTDNQSNAGDSKCCAKSMVTSIIVPDDCAVAAAHLRVAEI